MGACTKLRDDSDLFWNGLEEGRLLFQQCRDCGLARFPFRMSCAGCGSVENSLIESGGSGVVYSCTRVERPLPPGFSAPYTVVLVEVDEGVRFLGLYDSEEETPEIGVRVQAHVNPENRVPVSFRAESEAGKSGNG